MRLHLVEASRRGLLCVFVALATLTTIGPARSENLPGHDAVPSAAAAQAVSDPVLAPVWQVGDEWQYAYKSRSGSGTFVWSVNRIETVDGVAHYVIKTGTREILWRVSDLGSSIQRVNGAVVARNTPPRLTYLWPLTVGATWDQSHVMERPGDRTTENLSTRRTVEREEQVTVPAGTFRTLKVVARNANTGVPFYELWYAPDVRQLVKDNDIASGLERELLAFKLNAPSSSAQRSTVPRAVDSPPPTVGDLPTTIAALVKRNEALQPAAPAVDAERAALAHDIVEATRFRMIQALSAADMSEVLDAESASPKVPPKLKQALVATLVASFQPDRIVSAFERQLAGGLDVPTLQAGLTWERSELGRQIRGLELDAAKPEARAAKKAFISQFMAKGATATDDRTRSCGQKGIADDSVEAALPIVEAVFAAVLMADQTQKGQPPDMEGIGRAVVSLRPVLAGVARQAVTADCVYAFASLTDVEFERWLAFLRTDEGGRYARGSNVALRRALLETVEVFTRTLVEVMRRLKERGEA